MTKYKMKKLNKNPIDQYFRETLESPDLKYNKRDWKGLEARLPRRSKKKAIAWLLPVAAALLIFVSIWLVKNPLTESKHFSNSDTETTVNNKSINSAGIDEQQMTSNHSDNSSSRLSFSEKQSKSRSLENFGIVIGNSDVTASPFFTTAPTFENSDAHLTLAKPVNLVNTIKLENSALNTPEITDLNILPEIIKAENISKITSDFKNNSRLSLALSISPDVNSVSRFSNSNFGTSIGLGAAYNFTSRLSIKAGIGYSKKVYSAMPYEYNAPWAASSAGKYAKAIEADCRVLDIPMNFNYTFSNSPKRSFFASAGLSSYFMLKEKYTLIGSSRPGYPTKTDPSYSYKNDNRHLLSVINLSVGMSKPLSKEASIVIEPYAKIPYTGIGQGKVNLQSVGINFQLQYNFPRKTKLHSSSLDVVQ